MFSAAPSFTQDEEFGQLEEEDDDAGGFGEAADEDDDETEGFETVEQVNRV